MKKIYLLLLGLLTFWLPAHAQVSVPADSITQSLDRQLGPVPATPLQRAILVRQQLENAVLDEQLTRIPLLLDYLARAVPESVPTVQPREAMSLLLAAGAFGPLLKRVISDGSAPAQRRYRQTLLLSPSTLGDVADFYLATHVKSLTVETKKLSAEDAAFIQLLLDVLPRGGISPAIDSTIQFFRRQYPNSPYGYVLKGFQTQEAVKAQLRKWHIRKEQERQLRWEREQQAWAVEHPQGYAGSGHDVHFDGYLNAGGGLLTGSLGDVFQLRYNFFGIGSELGLGHVVLCLHTHYGQVGARREFTYDGHTHAAGNYLNCGLAEVSAGYRVISGKRLALSPFVGLSMYSLDIPSQLATNGALVENRVRINLQRPFTAGLSLDLFLGEREKELSWLLKVRTGVRAAEASLSPEVNGLAFYLNVGLALRLTTGY